MIEPEMAFCDLAGDMDVAEAMIKHIIRRVLERCHYRHADPMPLSGGVHKGNIVLLTRFPERQATAAGIERAVQFLSGVMDTVAKA